MVQAINSALRIGLERDDHLLLLGEDIGRSGGVFKVTSGLQEKFGVDRVIDTPLAEQGIIGISIGMAAMGLRPVAEIQFNGFSYVALDQLINHAARLRLRTHGKISCPLVLRLPVGGGIRALEHHSDSPETLYSHIPGLKIVIPSGPYDAKGLLLAILSSNNNNNEGRSKQEYDPTIFLEPERLYRSIKEEVPEGEYEEEIGRAKIIQEGSDISIFSYGSMIPTVIEAAKKLAEKCSSEIVDLRTLSPLDEETILGSVRKTGRVLIVHEAPRTLGIGAEIAALISEKALEFLKGPIIRVTGFDVPMPLPRSEYYDIPSIGRIERGIEKAISYIS
jgi:pyruvate/2-oxoglutarate/acetoin dehydrogenase E1 component